MQHDERTGRPAPPTGEPAVYTTNSPTGTLPNQPTTGAVTEPSIGTLFTDLTEDMAKLVRQEIELARVETMQKVNRGMRSVIMMAAGGFVAYAGFILLLIAVGIGLASIMPLWLSMLIVGVVVLIVGAILIGSGRSSLSNMTVVPENTVESIKEDARWAKEQVS
ncbi:MAG: phage holin family protein [Caldilineaceae bacterium]